MELNADLLKAFQKGFQKPKRGTIYQWAEDNISLPPSYAIPGKLRFGRSAYLKPVFEALQDYRVRQVICLGAVQTGKNLVADCFVPWVLANDSSSLLWLCQDDAAAKLYSETRFNPLMRNNEALQRLLPVERFSARKSSLIFPNGVSVSLCGANLGNVQSLSYRYIVLDEVWLYKAGIVREAKARATAFPNNSKILLLSQAGKEGDDFDLEFKNGHQAEWGWRCPGCGHEQPYYLNKQREDASWAGLLFDKNERTKPNGRYNFVELGKTLRLQCYHCRHEVTDTPQNRRLLNDTGVYIVSNPGADPSIKSFRWNAFANMDISFASIITKYLQAKEVMREQGYTLPMQEFHQKVLALSWNDSQGEDIVKAITESYDASAEWAEEAFRFLTVDVGATDFWGIVRAWANDGSSRLLWRGRLETFEQVREIQERFKVKDQNTALDSGFDATRIYQKCVEYGHEGTIKGRKVFLSWVALKGSDSHDFLHIDPRTKVKDRRIYSALTFGNPSLGIGKQVRRCPLWLWSNPAVKDILKRLRSGKGVKFVTFSDADDELYNTHLNAEYKARFIDKRTGKETWRWVKRGNQPNHFLDVECMQVAMAAIRGVLGKTQPTTANPLPTDTVAPDTQDANTL